MNDCLTSSPPTSRIVSGLIAHYSSYVFLSHLNRAWNDRWGWATQAQARLPRRATSEDESGQKGGVSGKSKR